ncbi:6-hydroxymethylpterin diphosphokinase MptE-like protein [Galenea microaerophila]
MTQLDNTIDALPKLELGTPKTNPFGDTYFESINQKAFDNIGAQATLSKTFADAFNQEKTLYFVVGSDSGLLLPLLQKEAEQDPSKHFVVFEAPEVIDYLKQTEQNYPKVDLYPITTPFEELELHYPHYISHNRMQLIRSLSVLDKRSEYYTAAWEYKLSEFRSFQQINVGLRTLNVFINGQIYNCVDNIYPIAQFQKQFSQTPALLLGGGPTLDAGIEWIKQNKEQILILAAGRISARLLKEGIDPDFIVTVDPNDVSYDNTKQMEAFSEKSVLIHTNYAHHSLLAEWRGVHTFTDRLFPWAESDQPDNLATSGPTVTNTMASIATFLGCPQIYLLGVDFCYGAEGQTHESSSLENQLGEMFVHTVGQKVRTNSGRLAETNDAFANAMKEMDRVAHIAKQKGIAFYNLGYESAAMENVPFIELEEIQLGDSGQKEQALQEMVQALDFSPTVVQKHYDKMKMQLQKFRKEIKATQKLAQSGLDAAKQLFENEQQLDHLTQKITQIKSKLSKKHLETMEFIYHYANDAYAKFMDPSISDDEMSNEEIKNNLINFFTAITETSVDILLNLDQGIKHINNRKEEAQGERKIESLINFWKQHNEEGRVLVWLKQYALDPNDFSPEHQQQVENLIAQFKQKIQQTEDSKLAKKLKNNAENLTTIFTLTHEYFEQGKVEALEKIANHLQTKESYKAKELLKLTLGYIADLKGQLSDAYTYYTQIEDQRLLHIALKRIVQLTLDEKDYQSALNALEVLTDFSDEYWLSFADLASALGQFDQALQAYSNYLSKHPKDTTAWIKLAKQLIATGNNEDAKEALNQVLKLDPENNTASKLLSEISNPNH